MKKQLYLALFLILFVLLPFLLWGDWFTSFFVGSNAMELLGEFGHWAWLIGILLLIGDLFLPLPGTIIIAALGYLYGPIVGGVVATIGGVLSGVLAYALCYALGNQFANRLLNPIEAQKGKELFQKHGGGMVAFSRWLPIFPEVMACLAGLNKMPLYSFIVALLCGVIPLSFVYAYIGHIGSNHPQWSILVIAFLPVVLFLVSKNFLLRSTK